MPRGCPKTPYNTRIDPEVLDQVRLATSNVSAAIEEGLKLWLRREAWVTQGGLATNENTPSRS